jgi:poly(3-hydroxybutyrate) depolymerase
MRNLNCALTPTRSGASIRLLMEPTHRQLAALGLFWPALAFEYASQFASAMTRQFVKGADEDIGEAAPEPRWTNPNKVALELDAVRLRDFSTGSSAAEPMLICAPFALHGATIVDFAPQHSLIAALQGSGAERIFVTEWRPATPEMRFWSIDDYLSMLNIQVDELGGAVQLVGLCQGGWLALIYAARFPTKVRKLALVGAPIDLEAGKSKLSGMAQDTPMRFFHELVERGRGRVLGRQLLQCWTEEIDSALISQVLQSSHELDSAPFRELEMRFRDWYAWTLDLPGTYYLQAVEHLYKQNRLARGNFVALGRRIQISELKCPLFLLAARDDVIVAPEQVFATERLVDGGRCSVAKATAPGGHLGLFMGQKVLSDVWPEIAHWLQRPN